MSFPIPPDSHNVGDLGHTSDHNKISDCLTNLKNGLQIAAYTSLASPLPDDVLPVVDVHDTSMASSGTTKKATLADLVAAGFGVKTVQATGNSANDWPALQDALLSFGTLGGFAGNGGIVWLPGGQDFGLNKPLILPSGVILAGSGWGTVLDLDIGSNCDVIQFATHNSASQAALLGVSAGSIANAFYSGVERLQIHGDAFHTTVPGYNHGINITTNPTNSVGAGDPDFDPFQTVRDVWVKAVTGDGIFQGAANGSRSGALFERVWVAYSNGNAFTPSFDTTLVDCLAEACLSGFYLNHGSVCGTGCKSYNNHDLTWVSGATYQPNSFGGNTAVATYTTGGVTTLYFCIAAVTSATPPPSDPAHWTAVSATAPQATGYGFYFDSNASEHNWAAVDSQQQSTGDYYFKGCKSITVVGSASDMHFNNGQPSYSSANPNNYAAVTLDGCSGITAIVNANGMGSGSQNGVLCTLANSPSKNTLIASTDGSADTLFPAGVPQFALVDGKPYGIAMAGYLAPSVVVLTDAATITVDASKGNDFRVTLGGNRTMGAPSSPVDGQDITFLITQDGTGSRTVTWNGIYDFGTSGSPTLSTAAAAADLIGFKYVAAKTKWVCMGSGLGF